MKDVRKDIAETLLRANEELKALHDKGYVTLEPHMKHLEHVMDMIDAITDDYRDALDHHEAEQAN